MLGSDKAEVLLALADGGMITAEELRQTMATGALVDLRKGNSTVDDPSHGQEWGPERSVRAEVLAELLTSHWDPSPRGRCA
jgi:hypothetical protein